MPLGQTMTASGNQTSYSAGRAQQGCFEFCLLHAGEYVFTANDHVNCSCQARRHPEHEHARLQQAGPCLQMSDTLVL